MQRSALMYLSVGLALLAPTGCGKKSSTTPQPVVANAQPDPATPAHPATPAAKSTPSDTELNALFERTIVFLEAFGTAVENNNEDCKKMATAVNAVFDANAGLFAEVKAFEGNEEVDAKAKAYLDDNQERVQPTMMRAATGMQKCSSDPDFAKAMERFDAM